MPLVKHLEQSIEYMNKRHADSDTEIRSAWRLFGV